MNNINARIVIIGAGHAGGAAAYELRRAGHQGEVILIGEEPHAPYQRPPLSKAWLKSDMTIDDALLRGQDWYGQSNVTLRLGQRIARIDITNHRIFGDTDDNIPYDKLIIATGVRPRQLTIPGHDLDGVCLLRSIDDAKDLKSKISSAQSVAIIGGGYIGLEVAATANQFGKDVTVIEYADQLMARTASPILANHMQDIHTANGVSVLTHTSVAEMVGESGKVSGVVTADGRQIAADCVLVGVGGIANDNLAQATGIQCDGGIVVDEMARTSVPNIYAIGDVSCRPVGGQHIRLESVHNALEQAKLIAADIMGIPPPKLDVPWFWSDQYDHKLQMAGMRAPDCLTVVRQRVLGGPLSVFHVKHSQLMAVEAVDAPTDYMAGKMMILKGISVNPADIADNQKDIRMLLKPA